MSVAPPPSLRPLLAVLAVLDAPARDELGELARRLDALFGPVRPRGLGHGSEPNGFRGLTRRGPYERLLLSEWALLDEAPDEFVRRAAAGEHAFYELETREPAHGLRLRAVFDAGPEQLGTPRIAQLAVLFVLLKRAIAANAELEWSVAQRPGVLHNSVDHESVGALLGARSNLHFELPILAGEPPADETWIIGPPPSGELAAFRVLHIRERLTAETDTISVSFRRPGHPSAELLLPVPAPESRKRLLTDPFPTVALGGVKREEPSPPPGGRAGWRTLSGPLQRPHRVRFIEGTRQLAVAFEGREVQLWSVANLPERAVPKPRLYRWNREHQRVAFGYYRGAALDVYLSGESLRVMGRVSATVPLSADVRPALGFGGAWVLGSTVYFLDVSGALWSCGVGASELNLEGTGFTDVRVEANVLTAVALDRGGARVHRFWTTAPAPVGWDAVIWIGPQRRDAPIHGASLPRGAPGVLTQEGSGVWFRWMPGVVSTNLDAELRTPEDQLLAFRAADLTGPPASGWLRWTPGTGSFSLGGAETVVVPRHPISVSVSENGRFLAFVTQELTIELWDVVFGVPLMLRRAAP